MSKKVAFVFPQVCKSWIQADVPDKNFTVLAMILKVFALFSRSYHYVIIKLKANFDSRSTGQLSMSSFFTNNMHKYVRLCDFTTQRCST